jgi:hypothetical protein
VELWAEDEARLGLKPVMRRVWAPVGRRSVATLKRGYEWTYLYGFVRPTTGEVYWLILPTVDVELFSMALKEFAKEMGAGKDKHVLLVVDQAGWHTGKEVEIPEGIHLEFLPSGSPELQPAERLWPLTNEGLANGLFEEIEEIEEALVERCLELLDQTQIIEGLTNYHWWPQTARISRNPSAGLNINRRRKSCSPCSRSVCSCGRRTKRQRRCIRDRCISRPITGTSNALPQKRRKHPHLWPQAAER